MIELPKDYYLNNFAQLMEQVVGLYRDLLTDAELDLYHQFCGLWRESQMLLVRMLTRKGEVFRADKLQYDEIGNTEAAAAQLAEAGLISVNRPLAVEQWQGLFSKPSWMEILGRAGVEAAGLSKLKASKRDAFDSSVAELGQTHDLQGALSTELYRLIEPERFETFKLLFFGNLHQDLTEFVLRDLGLYRFEAYVIDKASRLFESREQIDLHLAFFVQWADLEQVKAASAEEIEAYLGALVEPLPQDRTLQRRVQTVRLSLARQLERLDCPEQALVHYNQVELPGAQERMARVLVKQGKVDEGLSVCREILANPRSDEEAMFALEFGARTAKKQGVEWPGVDKYNPPEQTLDIAITELGVELDVAAHLSQQGRCYYVENALFCSLFGLHYWDLLFAPVKGAFTHPFQLRPHDLFSPDFLTLREVQFEQAQIELDGIKDHTEQLQTRFVKKFGTATPFVYWDSLNPELIELALERIPQAHWAAVFERIWADLRSNRAGFPDLVFFPDEGGYELVEVKAPGDRLQKNQLRWMRYFHQHEIPHRVIHVADQGLGDVMAAFE